jgi:hypothetical protein
MDKQLLVELKLYIERNKVENIIRDTDVACNYIMPLKSAVRLDKAHQEEALSKSKEADDSTWLEQFRKKSVAKVDEKRSIYSEDFLKEEDELEDYINKEKSKETFSTKLLKYIDRSELSDAEIYKKAGIDRRHFSKIRCDKYYQPKKVTAIALCMALQLSIEETTELLQIAGYSLSNSDTGDLVVKFCIEKGIYNLIEVNEALNYFGQKLLGVVG